MRVLQKIVLHPKLENDNRENVYNWCLENFIPDTWFLNSNYTDHGCFQVTVLGRKNSPAVSAFVMTFPEVKVLKEDYDEFAEIDEEAFNKNFEYI
jgi:hypothetical protein